MSESGEKPILSAPKGSWGTILAAPRLFSSPSQPTTPSGTVLRPPQLKTGGSNPFAKGNSDDKVENKVEEKKTEITSVKPTSENEISETTDKGDDSSKEAVPKFLPLHSSTENRVSFTRVSNVPTTSTESISTSSDFVFGQNLQERIVKSASDNSENNTENNVSHSTTNGTSDLLFAAAVKASSDQQSTFLKENPSTSNQNSSSWSWTSESPAPSLPQSGPILTGEEDEDNVVQMNCRLYAFEDGQWKERGRGQLRLNDSSQGSRLVCRSAGSLRVLLNTKVWGDMTVDLAGNKSLRVTATDAQQQVKVFLIMARPDEISRLSRYLETRVNKAKLKDNTQSKSNENNIREEILPPVPTNDSVKQTISTVEEIQDVESVGDSKKSDCNPVVIVSHESDESGVKRPLEQDDDAADVQPKKVCTEQPDTERPL